MPFLKQVSVSFMKNFSSFHRKLIWFLAFLIINNVLIMVFYWKSPHSADTFLNVSHWISLLVSTSILRILIKHTKSKRKPKIETCDFNQKDKYGKTGLSRSFSLELKNKLEYLMKTEKVYLVHNLKLDDIAQMLDVSRHHGSQVINENFGVSFYEYINSYRIEEVKKLLNSRNIHTKSISDIAYECGFNNRVSFYNAFRKVTRMTPKEFIAKRVA